MITASFSLTATERVLPKLALDFTTASLDSRVTFTRTGATATRVNASGFIETMAADTPRFDFSPVTLVCQGLLIEESRTNLMLQSETLGTTWTATAASVSSDATTSPANNLTADKIVEDTTTNTHRISQTVAAAISTTYTISAYAKSDGTNRQFCIFTPAAIYTTGTNSIFNLATGTIVSDEAGTAKITNAGNGWYRCSVTRTSTVATSGGYQLRIIDPAAANPLSYLGDGTSGVFVWGVQLEVGAFITSYIATVASTVTRNPDIATMTGTNFSSWFNASAGTFRAIYEASPNAFTSYFVASNGVTAQNSIHFDNDSGNMRVVYYSGSSPVAALGLGATGAAGTVNSAASSYAVNNFVAARNAGSVVTDTLGAVPVSLTQLNIGADPSGAAVNVMNSRIQKIFFYPLALTNAEVQAFSKG